MKHILWLILGCVLAGAPAWADTGHAHAGHDHAMAPATAQAELVEAEVRKVDRAQARLTLRHGELKHLAMPAMTMVFQVADPAMLEWARPGAKVRVRIERVGGAFTVTRMEPL
ncbi:MAG: copper-binding protein [Pseudomonadota bacterium]